MVSSLSLTTLLPSLSSDCNFANWSRTRIFEKAKVTTTIFKILGNFVKLFSPNFWSRRMRPRRAHQVKQGELAETQRRNCFAPSRGLYNKLSSFLIQSLFFISIQFQILSKGQLRVVIFSLRAFKINLC